MSAATAGLCRFALIIVAIVGCTWAIAYSDAKRGPTIIIERKCQ